MFQSVRLVLNCLLSALLLAAVFLVPTAVIRAEEPAPQPEPAARGMPFWDPAGLPDFKFTDRSGKEVTKADLLGKPWIAGFIFTRCQGPCPRVTGQMKLLHEQTGVQLVTFDVDPDFDTPDVLTRYADTFAGLKPGQENEWYFLTGDRNAIYRYIGEGFRMPVEEATGPDRQPGFEVLHSVNIMLVDAKGRVVGKYNALRDEEMVKLRKILQGRDKMPVPEDTLQQGTPLPGGLRLIPAQPSEPEASGAGETPKASSLSDQEAQWQALPEWVRTLPMVNASLNAIAGVLLGIGYCLIRAGRREAHKWTMLTAFAVSIVFLGSYLTYHSFHFNRKFNGSREFLVIYLVILATHVLLAIVVPVLASMTIYRGLKADWAAHRRLAKVTFPIWVYVSVTGVIIYGMLYHWPWPAS